MFAHFPCSFDELLIYRIYRYLSGLKIIFCIPKDVGSPIYGEMRQTRYMIFIHPFYTWHTLAEKSTAVNLLWIPSNCPHKLIKYVCCCVC